MIFSERFDAGVVTNEAVFLGADESLEARKADHPSPDPDADVEQPPPHGHQDRNSGTGRGSRAATGAEHSGSVRFRPTAAELYRLCRSPPVSR